MPDGKELCRWKTWPIGKAYCCDCKCEVQRPSGPDGPYPESCAEAQASFPPSVMKEKMTFSAGAGHLVSHQPGLGSLSTNTSPLILACPSPGQGPGQYLSDPGLRRRHRQPKPLDKPGEAGQALPPSQPPSPVQSSFPPLTCYPRGALPCLWLLPTSPLPSRHLCAYPCHQKLLEIKDSGRSLLLGAFCQVSQPV